MTAKEAALAALATEMVFLQEKIETIARWADVCGGQKVADRYKEQASYWTLVSCLRVMRDTFTYLKNGE